MENKQLIKELVDAFKTNDELGFSPDELGFSLDDLNLDEWNCKTKNNSTENSSRVCTVAHPSLLSILEKKVKTKEELKLLEKEECFVNVEYNDGSVLVLHTTLNKELLAKQYTYNKDNALFDLDRYRYFIIEDDNDCTQITITKENIYENDELISFINSVL